MFARVEDIEGFGCSQNLGKLINQLKLEVKL